MTDPPQNEGISRSPSHVARIAGVLETSLEKSVYVGIQGMILTGTAAIGYLLIGGILTITGGPLAPANFLSLDADPYFNMAAVAVSIFLVQASASLILYKFLTDVESQRSQFVILMSYIALGFGAAALKLTLPRSITFILNKL